MKTKSTIYLLAITLLGLLSGCASEFEEPYTSQEGEVTEVDIDLSFGTEWTVDFGETRAAPPGTGGNNDADKKTDGYEDMDEVDKVRVIGFKRREDTNGSFIYDVRNDFVLDVERQPMIGSDGKPDGHYHLTAQGKFHKTYGFEYRVIAVAYASGKTNLYKDINKASGCTFSMPDGEDNWFAINTDIEPTFEEVTARLVNEKLDKRGLDYRSWRDFIRYNGTSFGVNGVGDGYLYDGNSDPLSGNVLQVPQLFYGTLRTRSGSDIISYSETNENGDLVKDLPLSGILYRGVAKLEIRLKLTKSGRGTLLDPYKYYKWIALVADEVTTDVNLSSYDGFQSPVKKGLETGYSAVNYIKLGDDNDALYQDGDVVTMTTWFLPTRTRLALRIKDQGNGMNSIRNFQIVTTDPVYSPGNGTGVMSPDVLDGVFYFRRNHKYTILEIDVEKLRTNKHELK